MPEIARRGQCAPFESVDIAPEPEAKIMIEDKLSSCAIKSRVGTAVNSGAETIHLDAARVRHISR
ncbi:MAG: hypothetical protein IPG84_11905 [Betaproteobacteria bacterium]|nr:hypothetical protein [Betaproteobacteria bacterium]